MGEIIFGQEVDRHWTDASATQHFDFKFDNGYGASVIRGRHSYGGRRGLYELAVVNLQTGDLDYSTSVTDNVLGYLTEREVADTLVKIKKL